MARPLKDGLDYFPHDTDAVNDEKIEAMRTLYGNDGYAFYFILLERIYRSKDICLNISSELSLKVLARTTGVRIDKFSKMLETALELDLFSKELANNFKQLTNKSLQARATIVLRQRASWRSKQSGGGGLSPEITPQIIPQETPQEMRQSKVKESKVNNIIKPPKSPKGDLEVLPKGVKKETWDAFLEMRKSQKAIPTERAKELLLVRLQQFSLSGDDPEKVLEQSIANGWKGVFPLNDKGGQHGKTTVSRHSTLPPWDTGGESKAFAV